MRTMQKKLKSSPVLPQDRMMAGRKCSGGLLLVLAVLAVLVAPQLAPAQAVTTTSVHVRGEPENTVEGASSTLVRTPDGVTFTVITSELPPNNALTIWVIIFNNPELCSAPGCGSDDFPQRGGDPGVDASVVWGNTGTVVTADGKANFGGHVTVGDTSAARFGPGLLDPHGAEIHMIVRSHGPVIPELLSEQLTTFDAGCPPNECVDLQALGHLPFADPKSMYLKSTKELLDRVASRLGLNP